MHENILNLNNVNVQLKDVLILFHENQTFSGGSHDYR